MAELKINTMKKITKIKINRRITAIFFMLMTLGGCHSRSTLTKVPINSDAIIRIDNANKTKLSSFVSDISINLQNESANASSTTAFDKDFLSHLKQTNYFSDVIYGIYSKKPEAPHLDLSLTVNSNLDLHPGENATKAFFTGFTLFLLAPFLPVTYDFDSSYTLLTKWPSGIEREYESSCGATASGTWPYVSTASKFGKSVSDATEKCLNSVINQLTTDKAQ